MKNPLTPHLFLRSWQFLVPGAAAMLMSVIAMASLLFVWQRERMLGQENELRTAVALGAFHLESVQPKTNAKKPSTIRPAHDALSGILHSREGITGIYVLERKSMDTPTEWKITASEARDASPSEIPLWAWRGHTIGTAESIVTSSGGVLVALMRMPGDGMLALTASPSILPTLPLIAAISFLLIAGMIMAVLLTKFFRRGWHSMHDQVDADRTALIELTSHQLGAPLATFRWWLEALQHPEDGPAMTPQEMGEQVGEAVERMESIITAMNGALRAGDRLAKSQVLGSLEFLVKQAVTDSQMHLKRKKQTVKIRTEKGMKPVLCRSTMLFNILQEILHNAISFSPDESEIKITIAPEKDHARIAVADHGCGIPADDLPRITQKFFRASNAAPHKPIGNGLGLHLAKTILEETGGSLRLESTLGKGTTVIITLPFVKETEKESATN